MNSDPALALATATALGPARRLYSELVYRPVGAHAVAINDAFIVLADPEGNYLCVCPIDPSDQ